MGNEDHTIEWQRIADLGSVKLRPSISGFARLSWARSASSSKIGS